jgi:multisubunit Na+/H+ antiporter MnhB subunit
VSLAVDVAIAVGLVVLAWRSLVGRDLFREIVMFVVFGLLMAVAWARIGSADLAMAEAAIGAGVTGALLMVGYWRLRRVAPAEPADPSPRTSRLAASVALLSTGVVAAIGLAAVQAIGSGGIAGQEVVEALPATGLGNPITGVLVVFRNLDTVLEVAVLLAAYLAVRAVLGERGAPLAQPPAQETRLVGALVGVVAPLSVLVAAYLLWAGSHEPGGAFQAGATLAACGVLLLLTGRLRPAADAGPWIRGALIAGTVVFSLVGIGMLLVGEPLLAMPGSWAVYLVEAAMMVSIAATLALLVAAAAGLSGGAR